MNQDQIEFMREKCNMICTKILAKELSVSQEAIRLFKSGKTLELKHYRLVKLRDFLLRQANEIDFVLWDN